MRLLQTIGFLLCLSSHLALAGEDAAWIDRIRESQIHLAKAEPEMAETCLIGLEQNNPELRKEPLYCYQRFFVALEGRGDRAAAKLMMRRLDSLVADGTLSANSTIYLSVSEAWHRALFYTDSDLIRLANQKMSQRLSNQNP